MINSINLLAKRAKERLKKNTYSLSQTGKALDNSQIISSYIFSHKKKAIKPKTFDVAKSSNDDFYNKVCQILEEGKSQNPVAELIDRDVFVTLNVEEKQHYIYRLNQKFKACRDRYYKEHPLSINL